jgi:bacillithiol biosynthesis deacetylase BshB1
MAGVVVVVFAPHPDDAEIGMGGTIQALISSGARVVIVDLTDGEPTPHGSKETRAKETAAASGLLGITERYNLGLPNRSVFDSVENRKIVANKIRELKPEVIFAPYWEDAHPDHVQSCALIESSRFYSKFVKSDLDHTPCYPRRIFHYFSTHLRNRFQPSFILDVSPFLDKKLAAIRAYESQFITHKGNSKRLAEIEYEAKYWGAQIGTCAGEPFVCRETVRIMAPELLFTV